ncbi:MAG: sec-independent protein translocase protein TatA [Chloroflexota bacterium]|jgi:sec-independent protein translocase protein TatA|nr:sec-independent protein translocase protein TatA [Chloroflexota bacterium]
MPFINPGHFWLILLLLVVVLIIWGPGKLPDVGAGMGRAIREFKKATNEVKDSVVNATATHSEPGTHGEPGSHGGTGTAPKPEVSEEPRTPV